MDKRWQLQPNMHQNVFLPFDVCFLIDKSPGIDVLLNGCLFISRIVEEDFFFLQIMQACIFFYKLGGKRK